LDLSNKDVQPTRRGSYREHMNGKPHWRVPALAVILLSVASSLAAQDGGSAVDGPAAGEGWPREIVVSGHTIVIYQPQPETFEGNKVSYRAAVSVEKTDGDSTEAVFGAVWATARIETDRDERVAKVVDIDVTRVVFPGSEEENRERLASLLEEELPRWGLEISLDRLLASLEMAEMRLRGAEGLNMEPPEIIVTTTPSMLVTIEGDPNLQRIEDTRFMQVVNTPFAMLFATDTRTYYLFAGDNSWYTAPEWRGPWQFTESVPSDVAAMAPDKPATSEEGETAVGDQGAEEPEAGSPPAIVVATVPTELISIDGPPQYTPIDGTDLLFVSNTESDLFLDLESARYFVVLSGRWFSTASQDEPWVPVPSNQLPVGFSQIPFDSDAGHVLVWVAGTDQAELAAVDANVPQTAAVIKVDATVQVEYDGEPQFEPIAETELQWAVNSGSQVIQYGDRYYVCDEGVWFAGSSPEGPWAVADSVPREVYRIPADNPNHNVTYVYVYDSTPDTVYVGYLPGYTGSYVYNTTIVYGTGWYWPGWWGTVWIARPLTWGFRVGWNPWYGWGVGWGWGRFTFGVGWGGWWRRGWWGPSLYYRPWGRAWGVGWNRGWNQGFRAGYRAGSRAAWRNNMYRNPRNAARTRDLARNSPRAGTLSNRPNNVFADRNGNVHRQTDRGTWQQRDNRTGSWQNSGTRDRAQPGVTDRARAGGATRNAGGGTSTANLNRNQAQLNRSAQSRSQGTARTNNFNRSRSTSAARRGGGGRRR
jgi:hypothetical protein